MLQRELTAQRAGRRPKAFFWMVLGLALLLALGGVLQRFAVERQRRGAVIVADGSRFYQLADWNNVDQALDKVLLAGVGALMVPEYTGAELVEGALDGITLPEGAPKPADGGGRQWTALAVADRALVPLVDGFISQRYPGSMKVQHGEEVWFYLPLPRRQALKAGVLPDFFLLEAMNRRQVPALYRPVPYGQGDAAPLLASLDWLLKTYPCVKMLSPGGDVVAGSPMNDLFGEFVKSRGLLLAQPEFSTQVGASAQWWAAWPNLISLHAVTDDEVITRKISRPTMMRRLERAAFERNVSLLVLRPDVLRGVSQRLASYEGDVASLRNALNSHGLTARIPGPWPAASGFLAFGSALALGFLFALLVFRLSCRFVASLDSGRNRALCLALGFLWGLALWKVGFVSRLTGGLVTGLLAAEAALWAMDRWQAPLRGLLEALAIVLAGGLIVTAFYSRPLAMARLQPFSGVKLTLVLPLALVFFHDLMGGEHPERPGQIMGRSAQWAELVLAGGVMLALLVLVVRSDNTSFVPGFERVFREGLERLLVARPRTKEIWIGYPALVFWYYARRNDLFPRYREVLRLAAALAFSSAVNSFCHFHTPLKLTLLRDVHGWWIGLLLGLLGLFCVRSLWRLSRRAFQR